ncbi:FGGY family carbohydrate kinase [Roseomonas sp. GC11]|uniref:FGGY family carbohydrate kinase n=1 Tax=Roseomonas sp. GC11 TaxID=2950546 RepID=UPI00210EC30E|nr:FGGY family carbohydrate kinase [Roseomonas sp. GC11]MCQ4159899.1 FGGY family carbohydrate kinase [Roseomonas sp. GC11]
MNGILALDQGTTSSRAYLWRDGVLSLVGQRAHRQIRPRPGWVEHDAGEILAQLGELVRLAGPCAAAGLANQGETVVAWDAESGQPLHHAIVWQDERTADAIARLKAQGVEALTLARAGLPLDAYFSAGKLRWLLDNAAGARALLRQGRLRLGTSDAFFLHRLTGTCATDPSTASRTSLMDLRRLCWDAELCAAFGVPVECLPEIRPTTGGFGQLPGGARMVASVVDQQASLFGHGCREPGDLKITFGTGAFALGLTGPAPVGGMPGGLLPTCAWQMAGQAPLYALDGGLLTAGATIEWLRECGLLPGGYAGLDGFTGPSALARGLAFVPALAGLGSPHWDRAARGTWLGLDLSTGPADLRRAVLEGIALRAAELVRALRGALDGLPGGTGRIAVDGGLSRSAYFTRFLADALGMPLEVAGSADITALGVLHLCLEALGQPERPRPDGTRRVAPEAPLPPALHDRFARAIALARGWAEG